MVVDFCLKLTPTYDVISLSVAFKKLWQLPKKAKPGFFLRLPSRAGKRVNTFAAESSRS